MSDKSELPKGLTDDPESECIKRGPPDEKPVPMNECYLVLSAEERAKGFVRPVRTSYRHVGIAGPAHPLRDLTDRESELFGGHGYVKFEPYPLDVESESASTGRFWTQPQLDSVGKGCGTVTTMARELSETYARNPGFYGSTYCCGCSMHRPVGKDGEFVWDGTTERVGT